MAPTTTRDATSHSPIHSEAIAIAHAFTEKDWEAISAAIPAWHPRNEGDPAGGTGGDNDGDDKGAADGDNAGGEGDDKLGEGGKKALDAERKRAKTAEDRAKAAEARVKEFEDRDKSDLDKESERATTAEKTAREALRRAVAAEKGLPKRLADRLQGDTEEELEADADALLADLKTAGDGGKGGKDADDQSGDDKSRDGKGRFDGGSKGNGTGGGKRYTEAQISAMSPAEINANWADVQASMRALKQ